MDESLWEMRQKLRSAISLGLLGSEDALDNCGSSVAEVMDVDSIDLVELVMMIEEKGSKVNTVGDLMRMMDQM
jgi:acyl carrier protein